MRCVVPCLLLLVLLGRLGHAEDEAVSRWASAADEALAAWKAGDEPALAAVAARPAPPSCWMVAERLRSLAGPEAAAAYARHAPNRVGAEVRAWLAAAKEPPTTAAGWAFVRRLDALAARGDAPGVSAALDSLPAGLSTPVGHVLRLVRAQGLAHAGKIEEAIAALGALVKDARAAGSLGVASSALIQIQGCAEAARDDATAFRAARELLALERAAGYLPGLARAHNNLGALHLDRFQYKQGDRHLAEAIAIYTKLDDPVSTAGALVNRANVMRQVGRLDLAEAYARRALELVRDHANVFSRHMAHSMLGIALEGQGKFEEAARHFGESLTLARALGEPGALMRALIYRGAVLSRQGHNRAALEPLTEALDLARTRGDLRIQVFALGNLGSIRHALGEYTEAEASQEASLRIAREIGEKPGIMRALGNLATVQRDRGRLTQALANAQAALAMARELEAASLEAKMLGLLGDVLRGAGRPQEALERYRHALTLQEASGDRWGRVANLGNLRVALMQLGRLAESHAVGSQGLALARELGEPLEIGNQLAGLADVTAQLGRLSEAFSLYEQALAEHRKHGDRVTLGTTLAYFADHLHTHLGDTERAASYLEEARAIHEEADAGLALVKTLHDLSRVRLAQGRLEESEALTRRVVELAGRLGSRSHEGWARSVLGQIAWNRRDWMAALAHYEAALAVFEPLAYLVNVAGMHLSIGACRRKLGQLDAAIASFERSADIATDIDKPTLLVNALRGKAACLLEAGTTTDALETVRHGIAVLDTVTGGFAGEEAARAREQDRGLFATGMQAAQRLGQPRIFLEMLERARGAALVQGLGGRAALAGRVLAPELEERAREAGRQLALARGRLQRGGRQRLAERRALTQAYEAAQADFEQVKTRIAREARTAAGLLYATPATPDAIRSVLQPGDAYVAYVDLDRAWAVVLTPSSLRVVPVGSMASVAQALARLRPDAPEPGEGAQAATQALRALLIDPLGLPPTTRRLLVCATGPRARVPLALVAPALELCAVPSATTLHLLATTPAPRGVKVLALGDPDYGVRIETSRLAAVRSGATRLRPLPATRDEAEAIGDRVLLGREANELDLLAVLGSETRWRAIHLACHGLVDVDRPMRSALALTPKGTSDGLLTALEILDAPFHADLVALSACETARGRSFTTEGIVGLTRSFMYAGAPRVLCSLWKVDDAATRALMVRFYELWNPAAGKGLGVAAALRQAQAHVRAQPAWKHPYYWAAWTLWGLPE